MITMIVQGKNNIKQQRFKSTQIQYLNTVRLFVYFSTYSFQRLCLCGFKSLLVNKSVMLPVTINNIRIVMKNIVTLFGSPLAGTWLVME